MVGLRFFGKVDVLAGNLQELCGVSHAVAPDKELVPDPWGIRFYSATSWLGRILLFFYNRFDQFDEAWRSKTVVKVMEKTHRLYYSLYEQAARHHQCLRDAIQARIEGRYVQESAVREAKSFLTDWNAATGPFLKAVSKADYAFKEFLSVGFLDNEGRGAGPSPFGTEAEAGASSSLQKVIDFEGYLGSPLPLASLYKASKGGSLSKKEEDALTSFAKKIDRKIMVIKPENLNTYLRALIECFQAVRKPGKTPDLTRLTTVLVKRRSAVFNQKDAHHLAWRKRFKPGDKLYCNGIEVILGERLGRKPLNEDNNLVYEVANAPDLVATFGINRLVLPLKAQLAEEMGFGIRSAEYVQIEANGKFALLERLESGISDHTWTSGAFPPNQEDIELLTPIVSCIRWFISQNRTPAHFHPDYLMYDINGELKCSKYTVPLPFSLLDLEGFAWATSAGNPHIFKYIMQDSRLLDHEHARYFRRVVENICNGRDPDTQALSQVMRIKDHHYVDRPAEIVEEVRCVREECIATLLDRYICPRNLAKYVNQTIWRVYSEGGSVSTLPPRIEETVIEKVRIRLRLRPKEKVAPPPEFSFGKSSVCLV